MALVSRPRPAVRLGGLSSAAWPLCLWPFPQGPEGQRSQGCVPLCPRTGGPERRRPVSVALGLGASPLRLPAAVAKSGIWQGGGIFVRRGRNKHQVRESCPVSPRLDGAQAPVGAAPTGHSGGRAATDPRGGLCHGPLWGPSILVTAPGERADLGPLCPWDGGELHTRATLSRTAVSHGGHLWRPERTSARAPHAAQTRDAPGFVAPPHRVAPRCSFSARTTLRVTRWCWPRRAPRDPVPPRDSCPRCSGGRAGPSADLGRTLSWPFSRGGWSSSH